MWFPQCSTEGFQPFFFYEGFSLKVFLKRFGENGMAFPEQILVFSSIESIELSTD